MNLTFMEAHFVLREKEKKIMVTFSLNFDFVCNFLLCVFLTVSQLPNCIFFTVRWKRASMKDHLSYLSGIKMLKNTQMTTPVDCVVSFIYKIRAIQC